MPEPNLTTSGIPFPWRCHRCRHKEVYPAVIPYRTQVRHDGSLHAVEVPHLTVPRCRKCGELLFDNTANDQITATLRIQLHLLAPEQVRTNRLALGLKPEEMAAQLGMPPDTVVRLEQGLLIQSRALDNLLRLFFAVPQARQALDAAGNNPEFGVVVAAGP